MTSRIGIGGAPRLPHIPTTTGICPIHGAVEFRIHKIGRDPRSGEQRYRVRCPECHAARTRSSR